MRKWVPLLWLSFAALAGWVLAKHLRAVDFAQIMQQLRAQRPEVVLGALASCAGLYALIGIYEGIGLRMVSGRRLFLLPFRTALIANPIGRALGVAMVSGGALRYRMYSALGVPARQIAALIVVVAMPYLFAVGWLIDLSLLLYPADASAALHLSTTAVTALALLGLMKDVGWLVLVWKRRRPLTLLGRTIRLPSLPQCLVQIAFGTAEVSLMATILYVFMPPELGMSWPAFIAIYCIAFIAGQLSSVPAGLGVLEAALLLMLPQIAPAKLLGAVLAYRAVYEVLPLVVALCLLLLHEAASRSGLLRKRVLRE